MEWLEPEKLPEDVQLMLLHIKHESRPKEALALLRPDVDLEKTRRRLFWLDLCAYFGWLMALVGVGLAALPALDADAPPRLVGLGILQVVLGLFMGIVLGVLRSTERLRLEYPQAGALAVTRKHFVQVGQQTHLVFELAQMKDLQLLVRRSNDEFAYGELKFRYKGRSFEFPLMSLGDEEEVQAFAEAVAAGPIKA